MPDGFIPHSPVGSDFPDGFVPVATNLGSTLEGAPPGFIPGSPAPPGFIPGSPAPPGFVHTHTSSGLDSAPPGFVPTSPVPEGAPPGFVPVSPVPDGAPPGFVPTSPVPEGAPPGFIPSTNAPEGAPPGFTPTVLAPEGAPPGFVLSSSAPEGAPAGFVLQGTNTPADAPAGFVHVPPPIPEGGPPGFIPTSSLVHSVSLPNEAGHGPSPVMSMSGALPVLARSVSETPGTRYATPSVARSPRISFNGPNAGFNSRAASEWDTRSAWGDGRSDRSPRPVRGPELSSRHPSRPGTSMSRRGMESVVPEVTLYEGTPRDRFHREFKADPAEVPIPPSYAPSRATSAVGMRLRILTQVTLEHRVPDARPLSWAGRLADSRHLTPVDLTHTQKTITTTCSSLRQTHPLTLLPRRLRRNILYLPLRIADRADRLYSSHRTLMMPNALLKWNANASVKKTPMPLRRL
jgi:hypothetical protein